MTRTLMVDGSHLLHRINFTMPQDLTRGLEHGFIRTLAATARRFGYPRVIVCWDKGVSKRQEWYPGYKSWKSEPITDVKLKAALDRYREARKALHDWLPYMGVYSMMLDGFEADDLVAYLCMVLPGDKVLVTEDKDYYQLIDERTVVYRPIRDEVVTLAAMRSKYGDQFPRIFLVAKALMGDGSDGIPGVKGVGPKRSLTLAKKYLAGDTTYKDVVARNLQLMDLRYFASYYADELVSKLFPAFLPEPDPRVLARMLLGLKPPMKQAYVSSLRLSQCWSPTLEVVNAQQINAVSTTAYCAKDKNESGALP